MLRRPTVVGGAHRCEGSSSRWRRLIVADEAHRGGGCPLWWRRPTVVEEADVVGPEYGSG